MIGHSSTPKPTITQIIQLINNEEKTYDGDLKHYFKILWYSNGVRNPYHNIRHILHVLWHTYWGVVYHREYITSLQFRAALIASLFHDIDHIGKCGKDHDDSINIARSRKTFTDNCLPEDLHLKTKVCMCISATEFPHKNYDNDLPMYIKIVRDTDLASTLHSTWIQQTIFGLAEEMDMTPNEMLKMQIPFLSNMKFETEWARNEYQPKIEQRLIEVQKMIECLEI